MKRLLVIILLGLVLLPLFFCCQSKTGHRSQDKIVIDSLHQQAKDLMHSDPGQALHLSRIIIEKAGTDSLTLGKGLQLQGVALKYLNQPEEALESALMAEQVFIRIDRHDLLLSCFNLLGNIYFNLNDIENAKEYYNQSYRGDSLANDTLQMVGDLLNLSNCWLIQDKPSLAKKILFKARSLVKHPVQEAMIADNLSSIYSVEGEHDKAISILKESIPLYDTIYNKRRLAYVYFNLAQLYFNKNPLHKSLDQYLDKAYNINKGLNDILLYKEVYRLRAQSDSARGDFFWAFENRGKFISFSDSILNSERIKTVSRMQATFDLERKEFELMQQKHESQIRENKLQRSYLLLISVSACAVIILIVIRLRTNKQKAFLEHQKLTLKLANKRKTIQLYEKQKEIEAFLCRINEKNTLLSQLRHKIDELEIEQGGVECEKIRGLLYSRLLTDNDWELFRKEFISVYPDFYIHLTRNEYKFTPQEMRVLMLLKLGYSGKEIANTLGVAHASVNTLRYRLRKKLNMQKEETLEWFVQTI